MSTIETHGIVIRLPDDWYVFEDNRQIVGHGPDNTEVIATSTALTGNGSESERMEWLENTRLRIAELMRRNASHSELVIATDMSERMLANGMRLTQLSSVTRDGAVAFDQFMLAVGYEMLFITYEGPVSAAKDREFAHAAIESAKLRESTEGDAS
jgi:hypothetical protein